MTKVSKDPLHGITLNEILTKLVEKFGFEEITIEYQNIVDNVKLLDEPTLLKINSLIVRMVSTQNSVAKY